LVVLVRVLVVWVVFPLTVLVTVVVVVVMTVPSGVVTDLVAVCCVSDQVFVGGVVEAPEVDELAGACEREGG
jgi:hypothetical protein